MKWYFDLKFQLALLIGGVVLLLAGIHILASSYEEQGRRLERAEWLKKKAAWDVSVVKLTEQHHQAMNELEKHHLLIARETSEDHEQVLSNLRAQLSAARRAATADGGLRISADVCRSTGSLAATTETASTSGRDEASASTVALPQQVQDDLWSLVTEAEETSAQLGACQHWIRLNGFYGDIQ